MGSLEQNTTLIYGIHIRESANDGSDFSNGATDYRVLFLGEDGQLHVKDSAGTVTTVGPGAELDYAQITSPVSVTATVEASADNVVSGASVTYDGSTIVIIEFFAPSVEPATGTVGRFVQFFLFDGSSSIGTIGVVRTPATGTSHIAPVYARRRLTPSAAAHTYHVKAIVSAGTGTVTVGAAGSGAYVPGFIRITRV